MQALKKKIIDIMCAFEQDDMGMGTSGNVSVRYGNTILITPSGIAPSDLVEDTIVSIDLNGHVLHAVYPPSSEWRFHCALYQATDSIAAVVHTHSPYAVAQSCLRQKIPAFHYKVAQVGGHCIPCAEYACFGSQTLSDHIIQAINGYKGCLIANHGQVATGDSLDAAYAMAREIETLARQYILACSVAEPIVLRDEEMQLNIKKFSHYGTAQNLKNE